eukprot:8804162-Pyramimonas_sp.AAC.1
MKRPAASGGRPAGTSTKDIPSSLERMLYLALVAGITDPTTIDTYGPEQCEDALTTSAPLLNTLRSITTVIPAKSLLRKLLVNLAEEKEQKWKLADEQTSWADTTCDSLHCMLRHVANAVRKVQVPKWANIFLGQQAQDTLPYTADGDADADGDDQEAEDGEEEEDHVEDE